MYTTGEIKLNEKQEMYNRGEIKLTEEQKTKLRNLIFGNDKIISSFVPPNIFDFVFEYATTIGRSLGRAQSFEKISEIYEFIFNEDAVCTETILNEVGSFYSNEEALFPCLSLLVLKRRLVAERKTNQELQKRIKQLEEQNFELQTQIDYAPDGIGAMRAQEEFEKCKDSLD